MIGAARADREPQRHRGQAPRVVAGDLEPLDVHREFGAADRLGESFRAFAQRPARDALQRVGSTRRVTEREAVKSGLHCDRQGAASADRVDAELVAAVGRAQHRPAVLDAEQRAQREQRLVLETHRLAFGRPEDVLAADRARRAGLATQLVHGVQRLGRDLRRTLEGAVRKVARRQGVEPVEGQHVGDGAELAILRRGGTEAPLRQVARGRHEAARVGHLDALRPAQRDRLEALGSHDRTEAAATRVAAVVGYRGVEDKRLAGHADRGGPEPRELAVRGGMPGQVARVADLDGAVIDDQARQARRTSRHDDRVETGPLGGDREVARRDRVGEETRQRRACDDRELGRRRQRRSDQRR